MLEQEQNKLEERRFAEQVQYRENLFNRCRDYIMKIRKEEVPLTSNTNLSSEDISKLIKEKGMERRQAKQALKEHYLNLANKETQQHDEITNTSKEILKYVSTLVTQHEEEKKQLFTLLEELIQLKKQQLQVFNGITSQ